MPGIRLFIAIVTPPQVKGSISTIISELKETGAEVKWEPPEKLHATLKFLGQTDEKLFDRIVAGIENVCSSRESIPIQYSGAGSFPSGRHPRVVWIGIEDLNDQLRQVYASLEDAMEELGFERESRDFKPHLTIGRVKGNKRLERLLGKMETVTFQSEPVVLPGLALVKSDLKPGGSVYTTLRSFPFRT